MKRFGVNIIGLSNTAHQFDYEFGDEFFRFYGSDLVSMGPVRADVTLNKHETFIEADFVIKGSVELICDRSLEPFEYPLKLVNRVMFKFGDHDEEITDEIMMIHRDTATLDLGKYMYEFIALAIPLKKLHPKFQQEDSENPEDGIMYTSGGETEEKNDSDPRWDALKKLK